MIVGGGYAGLMAAARLRRANRQAMITLVDPQPAFVERIRLHEVLAGAQPTARVPYQQSLARRGIQFVEGRATSLHAAERRIEIMTATGAEELRYDAAILALGSAIAAPVPGVAEHALRLNDLAAIRASQSRLHALNAAGGTVLVVGGGLTGIEVAAELAERFPRLAVTFALRGALGAGYAAAASAHLRRRFARLGVAVREDTAITAVEAGQALAADGARLPFDLCVWCGGFAAPALARAAGLPVDALGRVVVGPTLQVVGQPALWAAGDAAVVSVGGAALRMGCVSAMPMGAQAGTNVGRVLLGQLAQPFNLGFAIRCISLGRRDALVQFTTAADQPRERVWTGRAAVLVKESICRMTLLAVYTELRLGWSPYRWPQRNLAAAPAQTTTAS